MKISARILVLVGTVLMGAVLVSGCLNGTGKSKSASETQSGQVSVAGPVIYSVKTEKVTVASLRSYLETNGDVVTPTNIDIVPDVGGKLADVLVQVGDTVEKGKTIIAQVDPSKPGSNYSLSPVLSPLTGTITSLSAQLGATVTSQTSLGTVGVLTDLHIECRLPEVDVASITTGLYAEISFPAFPGRTLPAKVIRVDPIVDVASRTKAIQLRLSGDVSGVNLGMFCKVKLYLVARPLQVTVPFESVVVRSEQSSVFVVEGTHVARRSVKLGLNVDGRVEVLEGLKADEVIVVKGQELLDDGSSVRVLS
jgi:multidrug efflux pump subunit AcrA (membrane-fusion protein)